jgi:hypothetical protein
VGIVCQLTWRKVKVITVVVEVAVNKNMRYPRSYWKNPTIVSRVRDPALTIKLLTDEETAFELKRLYDKRYTAPATVLSDCDRVAFVPTDQRAAAVELPNAAVKYRHQTIQLQEK